MSQHLLLCCDNCKRALCRHGEAHFPSQMQDAFQFLESPQIVCNVDSFATVAEADRWAADHGWGYSGLVFPDAEQADAFALRFGWAKIDERMFCSECGSEAAQDFLHNRRGLIRKVVSEFTTAQGLPKLPQGMT
jgi:hypothetical protein